MSRELYKVFEYRFKGLPVLTSYVAGRILNAAPRGEVSVTLDMGLSEERVVVEEGYAVVRGSKVRLEDLETVLEDDRAVYAVINGSLRKLAWYSAGSYYKLRCVAPREAPTIEINGIHMHRVSGITPWRDSEAKVRLLSVRRGDRVLDVCTGLGYTAIWALKMGANAVLSIEKDPNVLEMACYNPWSRWLEDRRVSIILGDASRVVEGLEDGFFDKVIHDPPRLALAGELYSLSFYRELYRVLKPGGVLVHYTGQPGYRRGKDIMGGVKGRLEKAGFTARRRSEISAVLAFKPR